MSTEISTDDQITLLDKQVHDLRSLRTNMKPWLAFVVGIAFIILGTLFIHGMFGILLIVLGIAGILAGFAALAKRAGIDQQIVRQMIRDQSAARSEIRGSKPGKTTTHRQPR